MVQMAGIATMGEGSKQWINAGEMENKGFELNLGYRNSTKFGLKYDINANLSSYRNKITALPATVAANGTFGGNGVESVIGHPNGAQVGYVATVFSSHRKKSTTTPLRKVQVWDVSAGVIWTATVSSTKKTSNGYSTLHLPSATVSISIWNIRTSILPCFGKALQGVDIISDLKKETDLWSGLNIGFLNKGKRVLDAWSPANPGSDIPALARNDSNNEKTRIYLLCGERLLPETNAICK